MIEYLQAKVSRLSKHTVAEKSRTIIRNLAKNGLMDDGKEDLLERKYPVGHQGVWHHKLTLCHRLAVGRLRMACDLVSQYVTRDLHSALTAKYEYVCSARSPCSSFTYIGHSTV